MNETGDDFETEDSFETYFDEETGQWMIRIKGIGEDEDKPTLKGKAARAQEKGKVRYLAAELDISKKEAGKVIHDAKQAGGLRGQQNLTVGKKGKLSYREEDLT